VKNIIMSDQIISKNRKKYPAGQILYKEAKMLKEIKTKKLPAKETSKITGGMVDLGCANCRMCGSSSSSITGFNNQTTIWEQPLI